MRISFGNEGGASPPSYTAKQLGSGYAPEGIYRLANPGPWCKQDRFVVTSASVLVCDPASGEVLAMGAAGWDDARFVATGEKSVTLSFD